MKVQCVICDSIENIDGHSLQAKRLRNRKINMYLCAACYKRIEVNTQKRHETGKFRLYKETKKNNDLI